jgi:hypothetical protein
MLGRFRIKLISNSSRKCRSPQRLWPELAEEEEDGEGDGWTPRAMGNEQRQRQGGPFGPSSNVGTRLVQVPPIPKPKRNKGPSTIHRP